MTSQLDSALRDLSHALDAMNEPGDRDRQTSLMYLHKALELAIRALISADSHALSMARNMGGPELVGTDFKIRNQFIAAMARHRGRPVDLELLQQVRRARNDATHHVTWLVPSFEFLQRAADALIEIFDYFFDINTMEEIKTRRVEEAYDRVSPSLYPAPLRAAAEFYYCVREVSAFLDVTNMSLSESEFSEELQLLDSLNNGILSPIRADLACIITFAGRLRREPVADFTAAEAAAVRRSSKRISGVMSLVKTVAIRRRALAAGWVLPDPVVALSLTTTDDSVTVRLARHDGDVNTVDLNGGIAGSEPLVNMKQEVLDRLQRRLDLSHDDLFELRVFEPRYGPVANRDVLLSLGYTWDTFEMGYL